MTTKSTYDGDRSCPCLHFKAFQKNLFCILHHVKEVEAPWQHAHANEAIGFDGYSILPLRLVSNHLSKIASDNELWKRFCVDGSQSAALRGRIEVLSGAPIPIQDPAVVQLRSAAHHTSQDHGNDRPSSKATGVASTEHVYNPPEDGCVSAQSAHLSWYGEYVARNAPLSLSWLQPSYRQPGRQETEIRGLDCFGDSGERIIAPLDDGSACIWKIGRDIDAFDNQNGRILARSRAGLLSANGPEKASLPEPASSNRNGIVECVSVDAPRNKAYFAVHHGLNEIDLETLQLTSFHRYPAPISVLSKADYPTPLTVGTSLSLHLHDPRIPGKSYTSASSERLDTFAMLPNVDLNVKQDFRGLLSANRPIFSDSVKYPCPLSILHLPSSNALHVAGRCPSILSYDRRTFPKLASTTHSSANLCCLTSSPSHEGNELIACGEYKSKGSLEIYRIPNSSEPRAPIAKTINRTSASSSKLLSVAAHGTRLVFSDGDGMLKWVENDGNTLVRRWNINSLHERGSHRGVFGGIDDGEENVARKILPLNGDSRSELAIWTGEKIGIVGFGKRARFGPWGDEEWDEEGREEREMEGLYGERMRRALERQADEVRFTRYLGFAF